MNVQMIFEQDVRRPVPDPIPSTLYDHYAPVDISRFGIRNREGMWPSYNTVPVNSAYPLCQDPTDPESKSFSEVPWVSAAEFAIYAGVICQAVGLDIEDQRAEILRVYEANEAKAVEMFVRDTLFSAPGVDDPWVAPVDVAPSGADVRLALAALEGHAAAVYSGLPTIWMSRAVASLLNERIVWKDGKAYTRNGSKVVVGGGLDQDGTLSQTQTLFATGDVYIERSPLKHIQSTVVPGDGNGTGSGDTGIQENSVITLVERMFRVAVDGFTVKATANLYTTP